ncbi:MAG: universal stress protein [Sphingobacteriales bacterium]|nr:MAG: universal stress protein [Sphingobacteriales bacterium]
MEGFKKIMIALDLTKTDESILQYTGFLLEKLGGVKLYCIHTEPDFEIPAEIREKYGNEFEMESLDEKMKERMMENTVRVLGHKEGVDIEYEVLEGTAFEKLVHWTKVKNVDLLVVGKKKVSEGSGIVAKKVARQTESSVLFVPNGATSGITKILVPIDFSGHSAKALKNAMDLAAKSDNAKVVAINIFDIPTVNYYYIGQNYGQFTALILENAQSAYEIFVEKYQIDKTKVEAVFEENIYLSPAKHINEYSRKNGVDFIVMGAKGHSAMEVFFYGSVTESLLTYNEDIPLLVVR